MEPRTSSILYNYIICKIKKVRRLSEMGLLGYTSLVYGNQYSGTQRVIEYERLLISITLWIPTLYINFDQNFDFKIRREHPKKATL